MIRLSFCIPTYNFAAFLAETLDSIIEQATDAVEIVIVDGGSTDETDEIVARYQERFPRLVYFKRQERCGVDPDILKSVELAQGEYCWLFSGDDVLQPGAVDYVLNAIDDQWNVFLTNFMLCNLQMRPMVLHRILDRTPDDSSFDLRDVRVWQDYLDRAATSTALFSYISSLVVKRADWLAAGPCDAFVGSCWIITAKVLAMMRTGVRLRYHPGPLLNNRGSNDSFMSRGIVWRVRLQIEGWPHVCEQSIGYSERLAAHLRRISRNEFSLLSMLSIKVQLGRAHDKAGVEEMKELACRLWSDAGIGGRCSLLLYQFAPIWTLRAARAPVDALFGSAEGAREAWLRWRSSVRRVLDHTVGGSQ